MTVEYFNNHVQCDKNVALIYLRGKTHYDYGDTSNEAKTNLLEKLQSDKLIENLTK